MSVKGLLVGRLGGRAARQMYSSSVVLSWAIRSNGQAFRLVSPEMLGLRLCSGRPFLVPASGRPSHGHVCWMVGRRIRTPCRTGLALLTKKLELLLKRPDASPPFATQCLTRVRGGCLSY